jgi:hypothetical protein
MESCSCFTEAAENETVFKAKHVAALKAACICGAKQGMFVYS